MHRALLVVAVLTAGCLAPAASLEDASLPAGADGAFSSTDVFPGTYDTKAPRTLVEGPYRVLSQEVALVTSDLDGAAIQVFVVRPDVPDGVKVPVVADAGPYFPPMKGRELAADNPFVKILVEHGFALALVSVRGTGDSGACMDLMGPAERHDIDQAITWLGTQEWSNGNVGMFGGSYDGSTQWEAASTGNPHLKTIVPVAAIPDLFEHQVRNGTASAWTPLQFGGLYWAYYGPLLYNPVEGRSPEHAHSQVVCPESMEGMAMSVHSTLAGERDPLGFWAERDWKDEVLANYDGSVFLIQGFRDVTVEAHNAYPFVNALEAKGLVVKHALGPWGHEMPWRADWPETLLRWYDRWLRDNTTVDLGPKVQVMDQRGGWRSETAWPPADATPTTLYLADGGRLAPEPAPGEPALVAPMAPVRDPATLTGLNWYWKTYEDSMMEVCTACATFETEPKEKDLRFAGLPRVHFTATPTGPGGHVTAILYAVAEDGTRDRLGFGQIDLRFATGDGTSTPVVPGQALDVRLQLEPLDVVVPAGERLVLVLHQGSYGVRIPSAPTYPVRVHLDEASALTIDVVERGADDFHDAPPRIGDPAPPR